MLSPPMSHSVSLLTLVSCMTLQIISATGGGGTRTDLGKGFATALDSDDFGNRYEMQYICSGILLAAGQRYQVVTLCVDDSESN